MSTPLSQRAPPKPWMPNPNPHPDTPPPESEDDVIVAALDDSRAKLHGGHDWTRDLPQTAHVRFFRETDWSRSALGPLHTWDDTLRVFVRMVLADSRAACIWWYASIARCTCT